MFEITSEIGAINWNNAKFQFIASTETNRKFKLLREHDLLKTIVVHAVIQTWHV